MADQNPGAAVEPVRAYLEYFRDLGVYEFYRNGEPAGAQLARAVSEFELAVEQPQRRVVAAVVASVSKAEPSLPLPGSEAVRRPATLPQMSASASLVEMAKITSLTDLLPIASLRVAPADRAAALKAIRDEIGDCTRCPLAYAGRRKIVFADGDPNARLMFVGEGPGADEDEQGVPFVGKSGQLLNNMIVAMGLSREQVYIANIVKCRPPNNRAPEPVEAGTCTPFLARQMDVVQPEVVVALGATAAMYLLGVKQSLMSLRGKWHNVRGAKAVVTYHPAFLLRDPRQKGEAWKDLQMVMAEMGLKR
jgi:uracil-DNA glycosylase family 4